MKVIARRPLPFISYLPDDLAPIPEDEGQTTVLEGRHGEGVRVVVKMTGVFLIQHALQESLAQRQ